ncbi:ABC transporter ATP-binding protein [Burkholderia sp. LMG 21824]|uniref:ABC transporter ATP-binding protein n=1 Tax=Burkholderia sp. LMG 21824 TaxID=3158172 RepID=UPI003C2CE754
MAKLQIKDVRKSYGTNHILNGVDINVDDGELLILVGPSGCGKSTLLNMIAGLETIEEGEIHIGDRCVNRVSPKDRDIAMVFQSYALYPGMTVRQNIEFAMEMRKIPKPERGPVVDRVAKTLQIDSLLERRPAQLSGGQRQRVAMGRALARNPSIFLFDEPLSNLDAKLRVEMRSEIKQLHQRLGATIVYVTHDQVEAMTLGDRIAVMKDGLVQQLGSPEEIYDTPANLYVAGFIGSPNMNFLPVTLEERGGQWLGQLTSSVGTYTIPLGLVRDSNLARRHVILGVRPEHFIEVPSGYAGAVTVEVELVEPTGADTFLFTQLNDQHAVVRLPPKRIREHGERLTLAIDIASVCFFDPATQKRIVL